MSLLPFPDDDELVRTWYRLRDAIIPYLGERAVDLFSYHHASGAASPALAAAFRTALAAGGDDPDSPQVTDAERLLIEWARAVGSNPVGVPAELTARVTATFQPKLRTQLVAFAAQSSALAVLGALQGEAR